MRWMESSATEMIAEEEGTDAGLYVGAHDARTENADLARDVLHETPPSLTHRGSSGWKSAHHPGTTESEGRPPHGGGAGQVHRAWLNFLSALLHHC